MSTIESPRPSDQQLASELHAQLQAMAEKVGNLVATAERGNQQMTPYAWRWR